MSATTLMISRQYVFVRGFVTYLCDAYKEHCVRHLRDKISLKKL